jgi:hypothetical protein
MEWVHTSHGRVPSGRRPVEGGYEESGQKLYHGLAVVNGVRVPGKAGEHLYVFCVLSLRKSLIACLSRNGCNVGFGGQEYAFPEHEIL